MSTSSQRLGYGTGDGIGTDYGTGDGFGRGDGYGYGRGYGDGNGDPGYALVAAGLGGDLREAVLVTLAPGLFAR